MADDIIHFIDDFSKESIEQQIEKHLNPKELNFEIEISTRYYVFITSYINRIQPNGRSGIVVIIRDMTNEHNLDQMKKTLSLMYPMNYAHPFPYYKVIRNQSLMA